MYTINENAVSQVVKWLLNGGVAIWKPVDFNHTEDVLTPHNSQKPRWYVSDTPVLETEFEVSIDKPVKYIKIATRISGYTIRLTDHSTKKVLAALNEFSHSYYIFDGDRAIIMQSQKLIPLKEYLPSPAMLCINDRHEGLKDPEITKDKIYRLIQSSVHIMDRDTYLSVIGDNGDEVCRRKTDFIPVTL